MEISKNAGPVGPNGGKTMTKPTASLLRMEEVSEILQVDRTTIYRWLKEKTFPSPIRIGPAFKMQNGKQIPKRQGIRWDENILLSWMLDNNWQQ